MVAGVEMPGIGERFRDIRGLSFCGLCGHFYKVFVIDFDYISMKDLGLAWFKDIAKRKGVGFSLISSKVNLDIYTIHL